jgi:hypothetical protein
LSKGYHIAMIRSLPSFALFLAGTSLLGTAGCSRSLEPALAKAGFFEVPRLQVTEELPTAKAVTFRLGGRTYIVRRDRPFFFTDKLQLSDADDPAVGGNVEFSKDHRFAILRNWKAVASGHLEGNSMVLFEDGRLKWRVDGGADPVIPLKLIEPSGTVAYCLGRNGTLQGLFLRDSRGKILFARAQVHENCVSENGRFLAFDLWAGKSSRDQTYYEIVPTADPSVLKKVPAEGSLAWLSGDGTRLLEEDDDIKNRKTTWDMFDDKGRHLFELVLDFGPQEPLLEQGKGPLLAMASNPMFLGAVRDDSYLLFLDKSKGKVLYVGAGDGKILASVPLPPGIDPAPVLEARPYQDGDILALARALTVTPTDPQMTGYSVVFMNLLGRQLWELKELFGKDIYPPNNPMLGEYQGKPVFYGRPEVHLDLAAK